MDWQILSYAHRFTEPTAITWPKLAKCTGLPAKSARHDLSSPRGFGVLCTIRLVNVSYVCSDGAHLEESYVSKPERCWNNFTALGFQVQAFSSVTYFWVAVRSMQAQKARRMHARVVAEMQAPYGWVTKHNGTTTAMPYMSILGLFFQDIQKAAPWCNT